MKTVFFALSLLLLAQCSSAEVKLKDESFQDGLARYQGKNGKYGYVDKKQKVKIPASYTYAYPFESGVARVCDGCKVTQANGITEVKGGKWSIIDTKGKTVNECPAATSYIDCIQGDSSSTEIKSLREAFPRNLPHQSAKLITLLKAAGIKPIKSDASFGYRAFDISCSTETCSLKPSHDIQARSLQLKGQQADELSSILFDLPIAQGDSGAETPFIECWTNNKDYNNCSVAIQIDYSGP